MTIEEQTIRHNLDRTKALIDHSDSLTRIWPEGEKRDRQIVSNLKAALVRINSLIEALDK